MKISLTLLWASCFHKSKLRMFFEGFNCCHMGFCLNPMRSCSCEFVSFSKVSPYEHKANKYFELRCACCQICGGMVQHVKNSSGSGSFSTHFKRTTRLFTVFVRDSSNKYHSKAFLPLSQLAVSLLLQNHQRQQRWSECESKRGELLKKNIEGPAIQTLHTERVHAHECLHTRTHTLTNVHTLALNTDTIKTESLYRTQK